MIEELDNEEKSLIILVAQEYEKGNIKNALSLAKKIQPEDGETYAHAQFFIGRHLEEKENEYWDNITPDISDTLGNFEKSLLGLRAYLNKNYALGEQYWDQINFDHPEGINLVIHTIFYYIWNSDDASKFLSIQKYYKMLKNAKYSRRFDYELFYGISKIDNDYIQGLNKLIFDNCAQIINTLHLGNSDFSPYGSTFAHYTRHTTALRVLDKEKSAFRLSSMHFMNDPTEGNLINDLLNIDVSKQYEDSKHLAFASCFSFNHNSLNQFRLYGKTDDQENSGVSLVFKKDFFQMDMKENTNIEASIARIKIEDSSVTDIFSTEENLDSNFISNDIDEFEKICLYQEKQTQKIEKIEKQPLYRCVYIDPESGYLRVARRSKISFYRSAKTRENALEEYNKYIGALDKADAEIYGFIKNLQALVISLKESLEDESIEEQEQVWALVNDILLPLRYLIKHAAFEEEEECRMIYITDICDTKIQSDPEKKWLYVEYAEPVKDHIKKVYLGDGAKDYRPFFERELGDKSKVKDSNNPFRT